eukprot:m.162276 g.162276  ORF g.162276 m.162276 type:complete len:425 (+) comp14373_c0_seq1:255-1529(+)
MARWKVVLPVAVVLLFCASAIAGDANGDDDDSDGTWHSLKENVLSYLFLVIPAGVAIYYMNNNPDKTPNFLKTFVFGQQMPTTEGSDKGTSKSPDVEANQGEQKPTFLKSFLKISFCVAGLQGSYLTWGVLQEHIMTQSYGEDVDGNPIMFKNSQFLVFINRILAFLVAFAVITFRAQPRHGAPTYRYSFASMSNVLSSWCQYEALKYVNFPTQVLAKSSKIIPVMIMGKFVDGKTYPVYEYVCAIIMSAGVSLFMFSKADEEGKEFDEAEPTSFAGILLLLGYMVFDSFTSNFQSHLFSTYKMSSYQMMFGVNLFSCMFTVWSLLRAGTFFPSLEFALSTPAFLYHAIILSITSATGQMFIFYTLSEYGALVFAIVMTTRQVISIFVSAVLFGHSFATEGWLGIAIVFGAMFARIYLRTRSKK